MTFFVCLMLGLLYFLSSKNYPGFSVNSFPFLKISNKNKEVKEEVLYAQQASVFGEIVKPIYGYPKKLVIESLGINANIVSVGVDLDGYLESPVNWNEVGWYSRGSKPAEIGNLLLNAHYDDSSGNPAIFWKLKNIKVGDKVSILDSYNRSYNYKVSDVYYVGINDPERTEVFSPYKEDKPVMTLITCGGVWSVGEGTYDKRLVVNAELIQE